MNGGDGEGESRKALTIVSMLAAALWYVVLTGFAGVPLAARLGVQKGLAGALNRPVQVASASFNPFTCSLSLNGLTVLEPDGGKPFFTLARFAIDLDPMELAFGRLAVAGLILDKPGLRIARTAAGTFNFADLLAPEQKPREAGADSGSFALPPGLGLIVAGVHLSGGRIVFDDELRGASHAIENIDFSLPYFSSLDFERHPVLETAGTVNTSPLSLRLVADLSGGGARFTLEAVLREAQWRRFAPLIPELAGLNARADIISLTAQAAFADFASTPSLSADLEFTGLAMAGVEGEDLLAARSLSVEDAVYDLDSGGVRIGRIAAKDFAVNLRLSPEGKPVLPLPGGSASAKAGEVASPEAASPAIPPDQSAPAAAPATLPARAVPAARPPVKLARLVLENGAVSVKRLGQADELLSMPRLTIRGRDIDVEAGVLKEIELESSSNLCAKTSLTASLALEPLSFDSRLAVTGCDLGRIMALAPADPARPQIAGAASIKAAVSGKGHDGQTSVQLRQGSLKLDGISVRQPGAPEPLLALTSLLVDGIEAAFPEKRASIAKVALSGGKMTLALPALPAGQPGPAASGKAPAAGKKQAHPPRAEQPAAPAPEPAPAKAPDFALKLGELGVEAFTLTASGAGLKSPLTATVERLGVKDVSYPVSAPVAASLAVSLGALGRVEADVTLPPSLDGASGKVSLTGLSLPGLAPLLPPLPLRIASGALTLAGSFTAGKTKAGDFDADFSGDLRLASLALASTSGKDGAWLKAFSVEKLRAKLSPLSVSAESVGLEGPVAKVEMDKDGGISVSGIRLVDPKPAAPDQAGSAPSAQSAPPAQAAQAAPPPAAAPAKPLDLPVSLGQIKISGAKIDFHDASFDPPFAANLGLDLTVHGLDPKKPVKLDLAAVLNQSGKINVAGSVAPLSGEMGFDLTATVANLDLAEASAYAKRFTGFPITTGKFGLSGSYKLAGKQIDLQNKIKIANLGLGPKAPDAAGGIPLDLAVGLLADSRGDIDLDIPVSGDLSKIQVGLGQAIGRAISGVFTKVLFGPFAFLSLGGKGGEVMALPFAPGSAEISPETGERLNSLAKAVMDKPGTRLEITGFADQTAEAEGIKRYLLRAKVAEGAGRTGQLLSQADYERMLPFYQARVSGGRKGKNTAEIEAELLPAFTLDQEGVKAMAKRRAVSIRDYLIAQGLAEGRIFVIPPDNPSPKAVEGLSGSRAELTVKR